MTTRSNVPWTTLLLVVASGCAGAGAAASPGPGAGPAATTPPPAPAASPRPCQEATEIPAMPYARECGAPPAVSGTLRLAAALTGRIPAGATIYLSAHALDPATDGPGQLLAVARATADHWPLVFELEDDVNGSLVGPVVLTAWYDQDQDAMTRQVGDVVGEARVTAPATGVEIVLDRIRERAERPTASLLDAPRHAR